ncbi:MAG: exodeoxyribonuclease V subunit beta [Gammaproteobacteria bacterium]|nr:exodeoxyribonuclease V subunit beta [Gammaproteobacteria bacterium]MBQ0775600.1 exodeoxyribonuclease V subunit beta [Gammaproteobacteria bacterium]
MSNLTGSTEHNSDNTKKTAAPLDIATLPLNGVQLIEASAGTGKTWSITGLYLRWVLGIGLREGDTPLEVDKILVVTFTKAAVAELRGRIRLRLREALDVLNNDKQDEFLATLLADIDPAPAKKRLKLALSCMDNAAIYTIHGFCKRLLSQYAFEAGISFDLDMQDSASELREQAAQDYWRQHAWQNNAVAHLLVSQFSNAQQLHGAVRGLLNKADTPLTPSVTLDQALAANDAKQQALENILSGWMTQGQQACDLIFDALERKVLHGNKVRKATIEKTSLEFQAWAMGGKPEIRFECFSQEWLNERFAKGKEDQVPEHAFFALIDAELPKIVRADAQAKPAVLQHAREHILQREAQLKAAHGQLSADDLLSEARNAIVAEHAAPLLALVRQRFPVAMVDEFQDTDAIQYTIFNTLYGQSDDNALLMIGDPKQAIYGFRGADIYAYLSARDDSAGQYHLGTNFRSTQAMVTAVNHCFIGDNPFVIDKLTFQPVNAADKVEPFSGDEKSGDESNGDDTERSALHFALADAETARSDAASQHQWQAQWIATEIRRLLGNANAKIGERRVQAGDIAVLVRSHSQAREVRDALSVLSLPCVYAGRDSVMESEEATDTQLLLAALVEPENGSLLRNALACRLFNLPLAQLHHALHDEEAWAAVVETFYNAQALWRRRGILPALYHLFEHYQVLERLKSDLFGERRLTDVLHLCELLQHQHSLGIGPRELARWLQRQREGVGEVADEQKLRLETDDQLVQITTIHGSKGLQYPIAFVTGMSAPGKPQGGDITWFHDENGNLQAHYNASDEAKAQAKREQRAEEMRLLYVALTRSVYRCYVTVESEKTLAESPLAKILPLPPKEGKDKLSWEEVVAAAQDFADASVNTVSVSHTLPEISGELAIQRAPEALQPPPPLPRLVDHWRINSYTGLTRHLDAPQAAHFVNETRLPEIDDDKLDIANFPRGARAGICLHAIFEELDLRAAALADIERVCQQQLTDHGFDAKWLPVLIKMVQQVLVSPFSGDTADAHLSLANSDQFVPELEFILPLGNLNASALEKSVNLLDPQLKKPSLTFADVEGMLRGFIDLVFVYQSRYWLVDYKSNWLGRAPSDYHAEAMDQAVAEHRYDIQAALYSVALHRYLQYSLPDYQPEQHFGGVAYLFLRGMDGGKDAKSAGQGVWLRKPDADTLTRWNSLLGGEQ